MPQSMFFDVIARDRASATFSRIARSTEATESRLKRFGRVTAGALGFTGLTVAATAFVKVGADYVGSLNKIQALSGITDSQLGKVSKTLEGQSNVFARMGQTTGDAANGMVELVKAGLSVSSAMKAVNATMVLAKAGEMSVADASSLVANTLNTFHLSASQAGNIANYLANAANISSANVSDLAESFKYVAPIAAATGVNLKQVNAILAELSNSGISASNAGTGFRKFLLSLQAPSGAAKKDLKALGIQIFDSSGKMKPLGTVIDILGKKLLGLTDQNRQKKLKDLFGLQGISSATVILEHGKKGLEEYTKGVGKAGAAQRLANANSKGFAGTLATLKAEIISSAQAAYRQLSPSLDQVAKKLVEFLNQMKTGKGAGGDLVNVLKELGSIAKGTAQLIGAIPGPVKKLGVEALIAYYALNKFSGVFSGLGGRIAPSIASMKQFRAELSYSETRMGALQRVTAGFGSVATSVAGAGGMALLFDASQKGAGSMNALEAAAGGALSGAALGAFGGPIGAAIGGGLGAIAGATMTLWHNTKGASDAAKAALPHWQDYAATLNAATGATTAETKALVFQRLQQDKILDGTRNLGIADRTVVAAVMGNVHARHKLLEVLANTSSVNKDQRKQLLAEIGALQASQQKVREQVAATKDYGNTLKGLPKTLIIDIKQNGLQPTMAAVVKLNDMYRLTPKQVSTLLQAANIKPTKDAIQSVIDKAKEFAKLHPYPKIDVNTGSAKAKLAALNHALDVFMGKAARTSSSLVGILPSKPKPQRPTAKNPTPWLPGGNGSPRFSTGSGISPREVARTGEKTGAAYITGLMKGIENRHILVKTAMDRLKNVISGVRGRVSSLQAKRDQFKSTFTADSIFGADMTTSGTLGGLMQFQADQEAKAKQLLADVQKVRALGLSGSLLKQLQSQGSAGADQLHLLAGASADQIKALNSMNAATSQALGAAGISVGNGIRGGDINGDIARAEKQSKILYAMLHELQQLNGGTTIQIGPDAIIRVIKKYAKSKGTTPAKLLATTG